MREVCVLTEVSPAAATLLEPVLVPLEQALDRLPWWAPVRVALGSVEGFFEIRGDCVLLSEELARGQHPLDASRGGPDRWRRAMASVLEGVVLRGLPQELPREPRWLWEGLAVYVVQTLEPVLEVALPERRLARSTGDLRSHPRAGEAVLKALELSGEEDVLAWARAALARGNVAMKTFVEAGCLVLADHPSMAGLEGVQRVRSVDVPTMLGPWTWARLEVPPNPRGGHVAVAGTGGVTPAWARANTTLHAIAGAGVRGCQLLPELGGPTGWWEVRSANGFGQFFGARGLRFRFAGSGLMEVILADAFVGSSSEIEVAQHVGTSGALQGRWEVAGPRRMAFRQLRAHGVAVHGRDEQPFVVPAAEAGLASWIERMAESEWRWALDGDRLELRGALMGQQIDLRLARASDGAFH